MTITEQAEAAIIRLGGDRIDPPILIDAHVPLELSGEAVRNRICTFVDSEGTEWAMRPDFTLAVAQAEIDRIKRGQAGESLRHYCGPVFRLPSSDNEPLEYDQVGLERFGAPRSLDLDVWLFESLTGIVERCGLNAGHTSFGDLSIFPAFVDAMQLPDETAEGLKRAFRQAGGVRAYLSGQTIPQGGLSARLSGMDRDEVAAFVEDIFAMTGVRPVGERSADEIAERLHIRATRQLGAPLSEEQTSVLESLLEVDVALEQAPSALMSIAEAAQLSTLRSVLDAFTARTERLASLAKGFVGSARFATQFGRRFTYYDGFVFEMTEAESNGTPRPPLMAGGRYDSLLSDLSGGAVDATALGGVIIPHRIARLIGDAS